MYLCTGFQQEKCKSWQMQLQHVLDCHICDKCCILIDTPFAVEMARKSTCNHILSPEAGGLPSLAAYVASVGLHCKAYGGLRAELAWATQYWINQHGAVCKLPLWRMAKMAGFCRHPHDLPSCHVQLGAAVAKPGALLVLDAAGYLCMQQVVHRLLQERKKVYCSSAFLTGCNV